MSNGIFVDELTRMDRLACPEMGAENRKKVEGDGPVNVFDDKEGTLIESVFVPEEAIALHAFLDVARTRKYHNSLDIKSPNNRFFFTKKWSGYAIGTAVINNEQCAVVLCDDEQLRAGEQHQVACGCDYWSWDAYNHRLKYSSLPEGTKIKPGYFETTHSHLDSFHEEYKFIEAPLRQTLDMYLTQGFSKESLEKLAEEDKRDTTFCFQMSALLAASAVVGALIMTPDKESIIGVVNHVTVGGYAAVSCGLVALGLAKTGLDSLKSSRRNLELAGKAG